MKSPEVARKRMGSSGLSERSFKTADEVVRWHGAMQAQDYGMAKWSIGRRAPGLVETDVDAALADGAIVRTHVLRPTWHFVAPEDIRWMLALTGPRVQKYAARRYRELGLDPATRSRAELVIVSALSDRNRLTRGEIGHILDNAGIDASGQRLPYLILHCELEAVIGSGGLSGKQHTYGLLDERVPPGAKFDRDEALVKLTSRYLQSHGPATVQDMSWWSGLTAGDIKKALSTLEPDVRSEVIGEMTLWSLLSQQTARGAAPRALLLQAYDELLVGYTQSRYFGDPRRDAARAAWKDRSVPSGVVLLNGGVAGNWRRAMTKDSLAVEALLYEEPAPAALRALRSEASSMGRFIGRKATLTCSSPRKWEPRVRKTLP